MKRMDRKSFIAATARGGVLAGLAGVCVVLASREEKFECSDRCGGCSKFSNGKCGLGLK